MAKLSELIAGIHRARVIDLSQRLEEHMPAYPTHAKYFHNLWVSQRHGGRSLHYQLVMSEHSGTHVDAPAHFADQRKPKAHVTIEDVPLTQLIGRGVRVDCREFRAGTCVSKAYLKNWEKKHGRFQPGDIVIFDFGWARYWALRPRDQRYVTNWPGVGADAAEYLLAKRVAAIGVDTLSPDPPEALASKPIHPVVLEKQTLIIENLTNLGRLPDFFLFVALPLKIRGGSGSPVRAVAFVE